MTFPFPYGRSVGPASALLLCLCLGLSACDSAEPSATQWPDDSTPAPEKLPDGTCWSREVTPAVYEHVMGEVQVVQAEIADDGTVIRPPIYRRAPVPRVVTPRGELRFRSPCAEEMTPEFIASLQRALAARSRFDGEITGRFDPPTRAAIKTYQTERGLESGQLSLETARTLGLVATPLEDIETF